MPGIRGDALTPQVSVIIPAHDVADWLVGSVGSALAQNTPIEVIVVDDASPDDGAERVRRAFPDEPRLRVITNRRAPGVCGARNTGLEVATAPWLVFLDGDDQLLPGGLEALLNGASVGVAGVFGSFRHVDGDGRDVASSWLEDRADAVARFDAQILDLSLLPRRTFNPPPGGILVSADALRSVGGWDEAPSGARQSEDFEMVMRVATRGPFALVETAVMAYLQRPGSRSAGDGNDRSRLLTRLAIVRRAPRRWRPIIGRAQGRAYLRLVAPRLRALGADGGLRGGIVALADVVLAAGFILSGLACWPLPTWRPNWPPLSSGVDR